MERRTRHDAASTPDPPPRWVNGATRLRLQRHRRRCRRLRSHLRAGVSDAPAPRKARRRPNPVGRKTAEPIAAAAKLQSARREAGARPRPVRRGDGARRTNLPVAAATRTARAARDRDDEGRSCRTCRRGDGHGRETHLQPSAPRAGTPRNASAGAPRATDCAPRRPPIARLTPPMRSCRCPPV